MQGIDIVFSIIILVMSVVIHEVSHGYAAALLGDPTAKLQGRLTLNPLKHLDLFVSFLYRNIWYTIERYFFIILIFFILFLSPYLSIVVDSVFRLIVGA